MLYNHCVATVEEDGIKIVIYDGDTVDREENEEYNIMGGPNYAFVYYPRSEENDLKYPRLVLQHMIDKINNNISRLEDTQAKLVQKLESSYL